MISEVKYRVLYGDTDCGEVMYYGNYLRLFEIGRTELIRCAGISYKEIEEREGIILPVVEVFAKYKASAKYDEVLTIKTLLKELKPYKIVFEYKIFRDDQLLTEGYTVHIPINREGKIVRFPKDLYQVLVSLLEK